MLIGLDLSPSMHCSLHVHLPDTTMVVLTVLVFGTPGIPSKHSIPVLFWEIVILYRITIVLLPIVKWSGTVGLHYHTGVHVDESTHFY